MDRVKIVEIAVLPSGLIDRKNAAIALGRSSKTLSAWARLKIGPTPVDIAGRIFYRWAEIQKFTAA